MSATIGTGLSRTISFKALARPRRAPRRARYRPPPRPPPASAPPSRPRRWSRVGHGLHGDRRAAAHRHVAHHDLAALAAIDVAPRADGFSDMAASSAECAWLSHWHQIGRVALAAIAPARVRCHSARGGTAGARSLRQLGDVRSRSESAPDRPRQARSALRRKREVRRDRAARAGGPIMLRRSP